MNEKNTVGIQLYTPGGAKLCVTIGFADGKFTETLPPVVIIDAMIAEGGYLLNAPGAEPGEGIEVVTHVMKRLQYNKSDGTTTPCIGFYHQSKGLVFAYWNHYLNTPDDIAEFEAVSGLKVADLPLLEDAAFPKRDDHFKQKYLVPLPRPLSLRFTYEPYTKEDGSEGTRPKAFKGFLNSTPQPVSSGNTATASGNSAPAKTIEPDFKPPVTIDNPPTNAVDEKAWKKRVMDLTAFLYNDSDLKYNEFEHTASIQKRMKDDSTMGINPSMSPESAATVILAYRATKDLKITTTEFPQVFNGRSLGALLKTYDDFSAGLDDAWIMLVDHAYRRDNQAANQ